MNESSDPRSVPTGATELRVWDPFVRFFHWSLVILFTVAFVTEDDTMLLHVWSGYFIGLLLALRFVWGLVGPGHARFTDFIYRPSKVLHNLGEILRFSGRRYIGHSPAGGAMAVVLILTLGAVVATGLVLYGMEWGAGPLKVVHGFGGLSLRYWLQDVHEILADFTLALVLVHITGVMLASFVHRENLVWSMITGRKRAED